MERFPLSNDILPWTVSFTLGEEESASHITVAGPPCKLFLSAHEESFGVVPSDP
jgi:hypothetical protein